MSPEQSNNDYDRFLREIADLDAADFDGHTCFKDLTPEQKIDWLAELVLFVYECRLIR